MYNPRLTSKYQLHYYILSTRKDSSISFSFSGSNSPLTPILPMDQSVFLFSPSEICRGLENGATPSVMRTKPKWLTVNGSPYYDKSIGNSPNISPIFCLNAPPNTPTAAAASKKMAAANKV